MKPSDIGYDMGMNSAEVGASLNWLHARDYVTRDKGGFYEYQSMF